MWDPGTPISGGASARETESPSPSSNQLLNEVLEMGYSAVGRKYGVSDTAVRKSLRQYEKEKALAEGRDPKVAEIPRRTWPNRRRTKAA
jgi:transposase-like protein